MDNDHVPAQRPAEDAAPAPGRITPASIAPRIGRQPGSGDLVPRHTDDLMLECAGAGQPWVQGPDGHRCPLCTATRADLLDVEAGNRLARRCPRNHGAVLVHRGGGADAPHNWQCPSGGEWWMSVELDAALTLGREALT